MGINNTETALECEKVILYFLTIKGKGLLLVAFKSLLFRLSVRVRDSYGLGFKVWVRI